MDKTKKDKELILTGIAFTLFFMVTCYKLTNASLWYDETVEYWYSIGNMPEALASKFSGSTNIYARIVSTFQPPLYNVFMHFWLQINDSEWWFRFFGVVMGFLGMIGIHKSIKILCNSYIASLAVIFTTFVYQLAYYWQECAEYCIMMAFLCWAIYFWLNLLREVNAKNIVLFTIFSIFPVYCQYGAALLVGALIITAFINILLQKNKKNIVTVCVSYIIAFLVAAVPLYIFFIKKQLMNQKGMGTNIDLFLKFEPNFFEDFFGNLKKIFQWSIFTSFSDEAVNILLIIFSCLICISLFCGKNKIVKWIIILNSIVWVFYYSAVKIGIYSYGTFSPWGGGVGSRYNLFLIPSWIVLIFAVCYDIFKILSDKRYLLMFNISSMKSVFAGICVCTIICYSINSWTNQLQHNWKKQDIRGAVDKWYEQQIYDKPTIIYYAAASGFSYYVRQNEQYNSQIETNVDYMYNLAGKSVDVYNQYVNEIYGEEWPSEVYVVASHVRNGVDLNTMIKCFTSKGYTRKDIFNANGGYLIRFGI